MIDFFVAVFGLFQKMIEIESSSDFSLPSAASDHDHAMQDSDPIELSDSECSVDLPSEVEDDDLSFQGLEDSQDWESLLEKEIHNEQQGPFLKQSQNEVFAEIFSRPRMVSMIVALQLLHILVATLSIDILTGYDLLIPRVRENVMKMLVDGKIFVVMLSPPCTMFSQMMRINFHKMNKDDLKKRWKDAMTFITFTVRIIEYMLSINGIFVFEHPTGASSWKLACIQKLLRIPTVKLVKFHQCRFGLRAPVSKKPIRKSTRFLTNSQCVATAFDNKFCQCTEAHRVIEGSEGSYSLSKWCEQYPDALCETLARSLADEVQQRARSS